MTLTNHALTGISIGLIAKESYLALPLALSSHFVLDALPHFGFKTWQDRQQNKRLFWVSTLVDLILVTLIILVSLFYFSWLVLACVFLAVFPDLMWGYRFIFKENFGKNPPPPENFIENFHKTIQKHEFPKGVYIEVFFAILMTYIIFQLNK
jgi:hypothetical protein